MTPKIPFRRCIHMDERGMQCDTYFPADTDDKLCPIHREVISPGSTKNGQTDEQKVRYIDLVNDERKYCYHFLDGTAQEQKQELIFEFKDDSEGSIFEKIECHIGFLEKVLEDVKARLHSARAVKSEKLELLSDEERKKLRAIKIDKSVRESTTRAPSVKKDPVAHLMAKQGMSKTDAAELLSMDPDALIAKFKAAKEKKGQ